MSILLTLPNVILSLKELIVVWINQILYHNSVYDLEIYNKRISFDLLVYVSRNPSLNDYLEKLVDEFLTILLTGSTEFGDGGKVNYLSLVLYDIKTNQDRERYILKFNSFANLKEVVNFNDNITDFYKREDKAELQLPNFTWETIHSQFKYLLFQQQNELMRKKLKRSKLEEKNAPLAQQDLFFKILVDADESLPLETKKDWAKVTPSSDVSANLSKTRFVPIAEVETGFLSFGLQNEYARASKE